MAALRGAGRIRHIATPTLWVHKLTHDTWFNVVTPLFVAGGPQHHPEEEEGRNHHPTTPRTRRKSAPPEGGGRQHQQEGGRERQHHQRRRRPSSTIPKNEGMQHSPSRRKARVTTTSLELILLHVFHRFNFCFSVSFQFFEFFSTFFIYEVEVFGRPTLGLKTFTTKRIKHMEHRKSRKYVMTNKNPETKKHEKQ